MKCPSCNAENNDSAKFCKKCGNPLTKKTMDHETLISSMNKEKETSDNTTKYIIVALIIIAVALAGAFAYIGLNNHGDDSGSAQADNTNQVASVNNDTQTPTQSESSQSQPAQTAQPASSTSQPMTISGGSFSTGSSLSDKTYASIYVGPEHSGENVKIQIKYSRDGSSLNNGNMVSKTVDSSGYINVRSADAYKYYPDYAEINVYDTSGNLLDSQSVALTPDSGTQYF